MELVRNPKMEGTEFWDCRPQIGRCPINCNECFYNREGAFYSDPNVPYIPSPSQVGNGLVRFNCGHDSNIQRDLVIETAQKYKNFFFNTSLPRFDFPGPVVFTANAKEEEPAWEPTRYYPTVPPDKKCISDGQIPFLDNLMFVRLRVSPTNLNLIERAIYDWRNTAPVVLTFMAYYDQIPPGTYTINQEMGLDGQKCLWTTPKGFPRKIVAYEWKVRHINSYFCPTKEFMQYVMRWAKKIGGRQVTMCSDFDSYYCRDCMNCETYYVQTMKHLKERGFKYNNCPTVR